MKGIQRKPQAAAEVRNIGKHMDSGLEAGSGIDTEEPGVRVQGGEPVEAPHWDGGEVLWRKGIPDRVCGSERIFGNQDALHRTTNKSA